MPITSWAELLFRVRPRPAGGTAAPGLYHYLRDVDGVQTRFHLRVEPDGSGMLLANAAAAARLSASGVVMARGILEGIDRGELARAVRARFRGAQLEQVRADLQQVQNLIDRLAAPEGGFPVQNLDDPALSPYPSRLLAPYSADVPLAAPEKLIPILDRLWAAGIPQVRFLAPPLVDGTALLRVVEHAEDLGMIAGARGRGSDLAPGTLLADLAQAGLDYVVALYAVPDAAEHDALCGPGDHAAARRTFEAAHEAEVCPVAEVPLVESTLDDVEATIQSLLEIGVRSISFFAIAAPDELPAAERAGALAARAMPEAAARVEGAILDAELRLFWQPPVKRNPTLALAEQVRLGPRCSGDVAVRVEPDGAVIPPRGPRRSAGNLLTQPWEAIWQDPAFRVYRERVAAPTRCDSCPDLAICAPACPRDPEGWAEE